MGRKYVFRDHSKIYFVTLTIIGWVDIFIREQYRNIIYDSIRFCQKNKCLEVYGYVIMTNHIHLIIGTSAGNLSGILRDLKSFTSRQIRQAIESGTKESRKEWMLNLFYQSGIMNSRNNDFQLWQQHNHPVELSGTAMMMQRLNYIHKNPVKIGFVEKEEEWLHSSAGDYHGIRKGPVDLILIE